MNALCLILLLWMLQVAAYLCGVLLNLVSDDDGESSAARHTFVKAGGMEVTCQVRGEGGGEVKV